MKILACREDVPKNVPLAPHINSNNNYLEFLFELI